jgi:hypothetical protein
MLNCNNRQFDPPPVTDARSPSPHGYRHSPLGHVTQTDELTKTAVEGRQGLGVLATKRPAREGTRHVARAYQ